LFAIAALWGVLALLAAFPALAQPTRIGLIVGNSGYSALPALPACLVASRDLAASLRGLGFQVIERQNVSIGALAAAIDEFAKGMEAAPGASVFVYFCGYGAGMNDRPFLLPVSASVRRPSDVMTQGLLAKAMLDLLVRGQPSRGVLALDLVPAVGVQGPVLTSLSELPAPDGIGLIAVSAPQPATGPTVLSLALKAGLAVPEVDLGGLLNAVQARLETPPATDIAVLRQPLASRPLAVEEPPPSPIVPPQPLAAQGPVEPPVVFPNEASMTDGDRRRVQEALARLGYYAAAIDGRFGPETRAAIRRYQHEIGDEMTGNITGDQASRLVVRQ
jgi:hypothetical protein